MKFFNHERKIQLTLDCGQKEFGSTRCRQCQMVYTIGDKEDAKAHKEYHRIKLFPTVRLPRGRHENIVKENFDGSRVTELLTSVRLGQSFYEQISTLMSHDLGYDIPSEDCDLQRIKLSNTLLPDWRVFVYVIDRTQLVVGCCIVEELTAKKISTKGYKLSRLIGGRKGLLSWRIQSSDGNHDQCDLMSPNSDLASCVNINGPICGVRRLWVERKHRRKGIASSLLDAVLHNLIFSLPLSREQTAFCEPTANGADFAASYVGREDFLIY
ncbi:N-acetyltransferase ESCO2 [Schistosoma japonicum]|uniref:N-acetyltransferase ESCO2 n=1 Tax=Schistosoma japonicum TaxID=6182 RepID=A0A4Z2DT95_SCHJA|nr:N-acetyltransferase ESCO2 [Schistosoma japonicum]